MINFFLNCPRFVRKILAIICDILLSFIALWIAFSLRLEQFHNINEKNFIIYIFSAFLLITIFYFSRIYSSLFRYIDKFFIIKISKCIIFYCLIFFCFIFFLNISSIPRSIGILQPLILLILIISQRAIVSSFILNFTSFKNIPAEISLVYGINDISVSLIKILRQSNIYNIVGIIEDRNNENFFSAQEILGIKIYKIENLNNTINQLFVKNIIYTKDFNSLDDNEKNILIEIVTKNKLKILKINNLITSYEKNNEITNFKNIDIEDLLKRRAILPQKNLLLKNNYKKNILITGAAGSIGSEISNQILQLSPSNLILFDNNEFEIYNLRKSFDSIKNINYKFILGDINNINLVNNILKNDKISTVYHCAAYKHVPILEENIFSCVINNIFGTYNLIKSCNYFNVENFVFISSDKAVNAESIMGKTKKFCELIIKSLVHDKIYNNKTKFSIVRFGNVLDSRGSVLPLFKEQIKNKKPITITDVNMKRFFMTIPEAAELVIQAGALAKSSDIFVLDMGKEIKIFDMVKQLIAINGLSIKDASNLNGDIEIKLIGLRPGEKLSEELVAKNGYLEDTAHPRIKRVIENENLIKDIEDIMNELKAIVDKLDQKSLDNFLLRILPR
jgi:FlaA1/EpsC-like NDP-sugar epimerase